MGHNLSYKTRRAGKGRLGSPEAETRYTDETKKAGFHVKNRENLPHAPSSDRYSLRSDFTGLAKAAFTV
jgi:hypothetical protein